MANNGNPVWTCVTERDILPADNNKCRVSELITFLAQKYVNLQ
jgi:hypothetical protein